MTAPTSRIVPATWKYVLAVAVVGILGSALTMGLAMSVRDGLMERATSEARFAAGETSVAASKEIGAVVGGLRAVLSLVAVDEDFDQKAFSALTTTSVQARSVAYAPLIADEQRADFDRGLMAAGQPLGINDGGQPALRRSRYLPVQFVVAPGPNSDYLGLDLLQVPQIGLAAEATMDALSSTTTPILPIPRVGEHALYVAAPGDGQKQASGMAAALIPISTFMSTVAEADPEWVDLRLLLDGQQIWSNGATPSKTAPLTTPMRVNNRLELAAAPTPVLVAAQGWWQPWAVLISGLLLTSLLCAVLWRWLDARRIRATADDLQWARNRLLFLAERDKLTGLAHRDGLLSWLDAWDSQNPDRSLGLLLIDLDGFKEVNSAWGNPTGDLVLRQIGQRLSVLNDGHDCLVARLGSDDFVVVRAMDRGSLNGLITMVHTLIGEPIQIGDRGIQITSSIGVVVHPEDGRSLDALLGNANTALRAAKDDFGDSCVRYNPVMAAQSAADRELAHELRTALHKPEQHFWLEYQPQVDMRTGRVVSVEALLRWRDSSGQPVPPGRFLPLAQEYGLMEDIGRWVLDQACRAAHGWAADCKGPIAVNVDACQLSDGFSEVLAETLRRRNVDADRILVEVTESASMLPGAQDELERTRDLGVSIAIDDFGTGYSSLSRLTDLPARQLKIDRHFVHDLGRSAESVEIVRTILALATALGLEVLAEGVETRAQADLLLAEGVHLAQGYLYAKPLPADQCLAMWSDGVPTA